MRLRPAAWTDAETTIIGLLGLIWWSLVHYEWSAASFFDLIGSIADALWFAVAMALTADGVRLHWWG